VRLAVVVQRYGAEINGGAELHARYIAEHLARHHEVEVLTTCARDYVTWANEMPSGVEALNGITVRRFPVVHERDPIAFGRRSAHVYGSTHSIADELAWLDAEGPTSPALVDYIARHRSEYGFFLFFSYRYHHAYHGARAADGRALLVPTAERDAAIGLGIFPPVFRGVGALMFNSPEERAMIEHVAGEELPGVVVGVGSDVPEHPEPDRFRQEFGIGDPFAVYVGRIDANKGCVELFDFFQRYARSMAGNLHLVLIGKTILPIPDHPRIHHLGFLTDQQKFDAMSAAELLMMPSYYESLSMVTLEAWALGKPVLTNAKCDVLKGQSIRSHAGLYYDGYGEFAEALHAIASSASLRHGLGANGRAYFQAHYAWPVIEKKYLGVLDRLAREDSASARRIQPQPGWFARRVKTLPAADTVLAQVPSGAVLS
jgi:glycosyltransferase involved in cell wall biosynthesis